MRTLKRASLSVIVLSLALALLSCQTSDNANSNTTATSTVTPPPAASTAQNLSVVPRPDKITQMMKERGEQDEAKPALRIVSPAKGQVINGSTVEVKLNLSGDLKGYQPHKDPATQKGNHIHVIFDNQPYEAYYELGQPFELRNVTEGKHTLRVFPSRPWHESYKTDGAFQMVAFTVKGGGDASKPTTTGSGQVMSNNNANAKANANASAKPNANAGTAANANASPSPREGKDVAESKGGDVDPAKPLLTYSRPKGEYKGEDADPIMIDFWLLNGKLQGDGGQYRVRYTVDGGAAQYIDKWEPIWLTGWTTGKHTITLELVDKDGKLVDNGGYNSTTRDITVTR
ncbi:MAG: hypothetical protein WCB68_04175 [Pyrinomonadaceae bacterium]